jgi:hypothetical protein
MQKIDLINNFMLSQSSHLFNEIYKYIIFIFIIIILIYMSKKLAQSATRICVVFIGLLCFNFSCQDHPIPQTLPSLTTQPITRSNTRAFSLFTFQLVVDNPGSIPVKEYGVVFTTYDDLDIVNPNVIPEPTILTGMVVSFKDPFGPGNQQESKTDVPDSNLTLDYTFQRAYAVLNNGEVAYGQTITTKYGIVQQ